MLRASLFCSVHASQSPVVWLVSTPNVPFFAQNMQLVVCLSMQTPIPKSVNTLFHWQSPALQLSRWHAPCVL